MIFLATEALLATTHQLRQCAEVAMRQPQPLAIPPVCLHSKCHFVHEAIRDNEQEPSRMLREFQQPGFLVVGPPFGNRDDGARRCDPANEVQFRTRQAVPNCLLTKATQPQPVHSSIRCTSSVFVWRGVILPDNHRESWRRCNASAERSGRGSGSGNRRTQVRQVSV